MPALLTRLARVFCSASAITLSSLAVASPPAEPSNTSAKVAPGQVRLEAMKVEIAFLGDARTYKLPVEARVRGDSVEVIGRVPNEHTRNHVLELARQSCYTTVIDGLSVTEKPLPKPSQALTPLHRAATQTLQLKLGPAADQIEVQATRDGQITLKGQVPSIELKLIASQCLREVPGCTVVNNGLAISAGSMSPKITQVGHQSPLEDVEFQQSLPSTPTTAPAPETYTPPTTPAVPSGLPQVRHLRIHLDNSNGQGRPMMYVAPATGYAFPPGMVPSAYTNTRIGEKTVANGCVSCDHGNQAKQVEVATTSLAAPTAMQRFFSSKPLASATPCPACAPVPMQAPPVQTHLVTQPTAVPAFATGPAIQQPVDRLGRAVSTRAQAITAMPPGAVYQSRPLALLASDTPETTIAAVAAQPPQSLHPQSLHTQPVKSTPELQQTALWFSRKQATPAAEPRATPAPTPTPTPTGPIRIAPTELARLVREAAGGNARQVRVEVGPNNLLTIHVHASLANESALVQKLMQLPVLAASNVKLNVHLAK